MTQTVILAQEGPLLRITLNRPDKKNALDREMYETMIAALDGAERDAGTRCVLFGARGGVYTAGNDLRDFQNLTEADPASFPAQRFVMKVAGFRKPIVAAVEGGAVGVGVTMLFHCDLVYASLDATFTMPFIDLGLPPEAGASLLAPRRFGMAKATQYLLLGDTFDAQEALRLGLVNALAPPPQLYDLACDAARRLCEKPAEALDAARRLIRGDREEILARVAEEGRLFGEFLTSPQTRARFAAFFEARAKAAAKAAAKASTNS